MASTYLEKDMDAEMKELEENDDMDDSDNDSGSEDEFESEEVGPEIKSRICELEEEVTANSYNYAAHLELVTLLKKTEEFGRLRSAREKFSEYYPLTGELWLEWIADERKIAASPEEQSYIETLYEKGVKDYVSIDLWLDYCQYSLGKINTKEGIDKAREIHEKAVTACGLHVSQGALIWEGYRIFEMTLLSMMASSGSEEIENAYTEQKNRIVNLFRRQLRQPLFGIEDNFIEYKKFVDDNVDANINAEFAKSKEKVKQREQLEQNLVVNENSLESYKDYIDYELKEKDPARAQMIYERAIYAHCLEPHLWSQYLTYLDSTLKISSVSLPVFERAIRNVPWSIEIWCSYLRSLERYEKPHRDILSIFEQALAAGFSDGNSYLELWLCFIDYMRRRTVWSKDITESMSDLRTVFERAIQHLLKCGGDPDFEVSKYSANLEADHFGMMENARTIWAEIVAAHPFKACVWMEFIQLEKTFGDKKHLRKAFQRALEKVYDNPDVIIKAFIQFEREEGSLEAYEHCIKLCNIKKGKMEAHRSKEEAKKSADEQARNEKMEKRKDKDKQFKIAKKQQAISSKQNSKDILNGNITSTSASESVCHESKPVEPPPGYAATKRTVAPPPGFKENVKRSNGDASGFKEPLPKKIKTDDFKNLSEEEQKKLRTVFLSNLDYTVSDSDIKDIMKSSGIVLDVRLVKKPNGQSKGYAFVEYENYDDAVKALKRDNELLGQRPMYISKCIDKNTDKKEPAFKFNTGLEKNKLFVKNLDPETTQKELVEVFMKFGKLKEVRLPTYRNGHSKGIAFVDYEDEVSAATALIKTDNMKLKSKEIRVALSNPPKRDEPVNASEIKSLGGTESTEFGPRGKGRSQIAFTPRSVSVLKKEVNGASNSQTESEVERPAKSNDDFRKMLLR